MNFNDLLDEDGQGTRELDAWLSENIDGKKIKYTDNYPVSGGEKDYYMYKEIKLDNTVMKTYASVRKYTTGGAIDLIWELAKDYFKDYTLSSNYFLGIKNGEPYTGDSCIEQLAIAEALFRAHQKEEALDSLIDQSQDMDAYDGGGWEINNE